MKTSALVIGVGSRPGDSHLMEMTSTDASFVSGELSARCRIPSGKLKILRDKEATTSEVLEYLDSLEEETLEDPLDMFIFYFSGHGCVLKGNYFLICNDTSNKNIQSTGIGAEVLVNKLQQINTQRMLVVLDCCHAEGMTATDENPVSENIVTLNKPNRIVLSASRFEQVSFLSKPVSVFTYAFLEGLGGKFLGENEKEVNVFDLAMYVRERVAPLSRGRQKPQLSVLQNNLTSNFVIARYPKGRPSQPVFDESFSLLDADGKEIDTSLAGDNDADYRKRFNWIRVNIELSDDSDMIITVSGDVKTVSVNLLNVSEITDKMDQIAELRKDLLNEQVEERRLVKSERINRLRNEVDKQKENITSLARTLSKIEINTERLKNAYFEFLKGNIRYADEILNRDELLKEQLLLIAEKDDLKIRMDENKAMRMHNADEFLMKARVTLLRYEIPERFELADEYFRNSIRSFRHTKNLFEYGAYLREQNRYKDAIPVFEDCIKIYESAPGDSKFYMPDIASAYANLGYCLEKRRDDRSAENCYVRSMMIYRKLEEDNPGSYGIDLAEAYNILANFCQEQKDFISAEQFYLESFEIRKKLSQSGKGDDIRSMFIARNNLGKHYMERGDYGKAITNFREAVSIAEQTAGSFPGKYDSDLSLVLSNIGKAYIDLDKFPEANKALTESLKIREQLYRLNPGAYGPSLANTLNLFSLLSGKVKDTVSSEKFSERALKIREDLFNVDPVTYAPDFAEALNNLGITYAKAGAVQAAERLLTRSLVIREQLSQSSPARYEISLSQTNLALGILKMNSGNTAGGIENIRRARELASRYAGNSIADNVMKNASGILINAGDEK